MKNKLHELVGKGCLCVISLIFGIFAGDKLLWSVSVPHWVGLIFGIVISIGIAYFLLREEK